jgi:simple sugar transport system ATP-binding protein
VVQLAGITKAFGHVTAINHASFDLLPGEIHALLGENGAGKTTLMNILYGLHQPDTGEIIIQGQPRTLTSPREAIALGLGMVHQQFMQVPTLTVVDNVLLGLTRGHNPLLDRRQARQRLAEIIEAYGLTVDPEARVWQLSIGDRQRVEIIKALYRQARVLILDEPTSVLTPTEAENLFATLTVLVRQGLSIIFITHVLEEALSISHRVTVLRDGHVVATLPTSQTHKVELARLMVGREVLFRLERNGPDQPAGEEMLRVERLSVVGDRGTQAVREVSFNLRRGEIVGIAGVEGNGQSELVQALTGLRSPTEGRIWLNGADLTFASPRQILQHGVGHIPENLADALVGDFNLAENLALDTHYTPTFAHYGWLKQKGMIWQARELIKQYNIRASGEKAKARTLSGGNKQKVVIARELSRRPRLLIAAHPTRGLDIGAEEYIRNLLLEQRRAGMAILLISTKLDEILSLSDRILVMQGGRIRGELTHQTATLEQIGLLMAGTEV